MVESSCRLTVAPPRPGEGARALIERRAQDPKAPALEGEDDDFARYAFALRAYAYRAWTLCGTVTP